MSLLRWYEKNHSRLRNPLLIIIAVTGLYHVPLARDFLSFLDYELLGTITLGSILGTITALIALAIYYHKFG